MSELPERRRHPRRPITRSAKFFHEPSLRYADATTIDVSDGGALVEVRPVRVYFPGDRVRLAIDFPAMGILRASEMVGATIVRAEPERDGVRLLALALDEAVASAGHRLAA